MSVCDKSSAPGKESRRVYRTSGRQTGLQAELVVGSRSVLVVLLDISALGAGFFVPRASARMLAPRSGQPPSSIRLRLSGFVEGSFVSLPIKIIHRRVYPEGIRLSTSFEMDPERRATLSQRLCEVLNERRAIRVRAPEDVLIRAGVDIPGVGWAYGQLLDASAVGLGLDIPFEGDASALVGQTIPTRVWFSSDELVSLDTRLVRVVALRDEHGNVREGRKLFGLVFGEESEGICRGGLAVGRWVVRQQLAARAAEQE